jgi:hypothetical protein
MKKRAKSRRNGDSAENRSLDDRDYHGWWWREDMHTQCGTWNIFPVGGGKLAVGGGRLWVSRTGCVRMRNTLFWLLAGGRFLGGWCLGGWGLGGYSEAQARTARRGTEEPPLLARLSGVPPARRRGRRRFSRRGRRRSVGGGPPALHQGARSAVSRCFGLRQ